MRFSLKELTGRATHTFCVATVAVRSCVFLLSSEERSESIRNYTLLVVSERRQVTHSETHVVKNIQEELQTQCITSSSHYNVFKKVP